MCKSKRNSASGFFTITRSCFDFCTNDGGKLPAKKHPKPQEVERWEELRYAAFIIHLWMEMKSQERCTTDLTCHRQVYGFTKGIKIRLKKLLVSQNHLGNTIFSSHKTGYITCTHCCDGNDTLTDELSSFLQSHNPERSQLWHHNLAWNKHKTEISGSLNLLTTIIPHTCAVVYL